MSDLGTRLRTFLAELKRRKVYRTAVVYGVVAFGVWQVADYLFPALDFPAWTVDFVVVFSVLGFPLVLVLAWAFDLTPEGVERTRPGEDSARSSTSRYGGALVGLGLVLMAAGAGAWYLSAGGPDPEPRAGERSIAVLPFEDLGQEEPGTFAEGMHDALLTRLSNISDLKVISRTSVQQYRETDKTTSEIARELGVTWILEGGVQEMGDGIQVNAQLIDPRTDTHAWAESYRRDLTAADLFDLQSEITRRIAGALEMRLTADEERRVDRRPTEDLDAYRLYVEGRHLLAQRTKEANEEAITYFRRALAEDSTFALAWAGLADAVSLLQWPPPDTALAVQERAARRAAELNPELAEARASLGFFHLTRMNGPEAFRELERAVELRPSYAQGHHWLGALQLMVGRPEVALEHLSLAVELNPRNRSAPGELILAQLANGRYDEALARSRARARPDEGVEMREWDSWVEEAGTFWRIYEVTALVHLKRWDEARDVAREFLSASGERGPPPVRTDLAMVEITVGDTASARERLGRLQEGGFPSSGALILAALGDHDAALSVLDTLAAAGPRAHFQLIPVRFLYPDALEAFRADPRYEPFLTRVYEAWGFESDGSTPGSV